VTPEQLKFDESLLQRLFCWGDSQSDIYLPAEPEGMTKKEYCAQTEPPVLTYTAHSVPLDMIFYTASW
jgi:glucose/arabinose dehydrogenase